MKTNPAPTADLLARTAALAAELSRIYAQLAQATDLTPPTLITLPRERTDPEQERLLTGEQVALILALDVAAVARRRFPFRVKLGHRTVRYSEAGLERWMRSGKT